MIGEILRGVWGSPLKRPSTACAKAVSSLSRESKYANNHLRHVGFFPNDANANDRLCKLLQGNFK